MKYAIILNEKAERKDDLFGNLHEIKKMENVKERIKAAMLTVGLERLNRKGSGIVIASLHRDKDEMGGELFKFEADQEQLWKITEAIKVIQKEIERPEYLGIFQLQYRII